jgi:tRNA(Arg) A34 adenosine deaminase TadA
VAANTTLGSERCKKEVTMNKNKLDRALTPDQLRELDEIRATLAGIRPTHKHDGIAKLLAVEAIEAALEGNKGVAALATIPRLEGNAIPVLRRQEMGIIKHSQNFWRMCRKNQRYFPEPRNVRHAESVLGMDLETMYYAGEIGQVVVVFSSLEPCSKCLPQLIDCKPVIMVFYVAPDPGGGQVEAHEGDGILRLDKLPWNFRENAAYKIKRPGGERFPMTIGRADCSQALREICWRIFEITDPDAGKRRPDQAARLHQLSALTWKTLRQPTCACCGSAKTLRCS